MPASPIGHALNFSSLSHPVGWFAGRKVTVALTDQSGAEQRLSNLEAPPFVPAHLLTLFDSPPGAFVADAPPLACLLGSRWGVVVFAVVAA